MGIAVLLLLNLAPSQAPAKQYQDRPMPQLVSQFWQKLANAKTISLTVSEWTPGPRKSREDPIILDHADVADVKIQRPNLLSIMYQPIKPTTTPGPGGTVEYSFRGDDTSYVCDGQRAIELFLHVHRYGPAAPLKSLGQRNDNYLRRVFLDWAFDSDPMHWKKPYKKDSRKQPPVFGIVYVAKNPKFPRYEEWYYFDAKSGNLVQKSAYGWDAKGQVSEESRVQYKNWTIGSSFPPGAFNASPPQGWTLMSPR